MILDQVQTGDMAADLTELFEQYYESLVRAFKHSGGGKLVEELERIVRGIQREMGY